jgi:aromatic-L-amino-acid/L-tryptophan decarboxylase
VSTRDSFAPLGDIPSEDFRGQLHQLADWIADYRATIDARIVARKIEAGAIVRALPGHPPEQAEAFSNIWNDFQEIVLPGIVHWGHPQFLGYFGSTTTGPGILAEMIAAALNVNAMTWRTSPAATELETVVLRWLREWLGLPETFEGVVYDTASVSTLHALAAAREQAATAVRESGLTGRDLPVFRLYTSDQAHSSVEKAAIALGLGEQNVRRVPTDSAFRMEMNALKQHVEADLHRGFKPLAVVATVGTTSSASIDPVEAVARFCREHGIWLHIDAAYGGGMALLPEAAWIREGWANADSFVINPHKMLFVPFDFSALYVREISRLRRVFALVPDYLNGDSARADIDYMDYGVQLGRRFRAIKAWFVWRSLGREGIATRIREHLRLARLFAQWVEKDGRFEILAPVTMGVVCFGPIGYSEEACAALVDHLNTNGETYLTHTKLHGRVAIRLALGNVLTTETHLRNVWRLIRDAIEQPRSTDSLGSRDSCYSRLENSGDSCSGPRDRRVLESECTVDSPSA